MGGTRNKEGLLSLDVKGVPDLSLLLLGQVKDRSVKLEIPGDHNALTRGPDLNDSLCIPR